VHKMNMNVPANRNLVRGVMAVIMASRKRPDLPHGGRLRSPDSAAWRAATLARLCRDDARLNRFWHKFRDAHFVEVTADHLVTAAPVGFSGARSEFL
jgi:hypothetical protein